MPRANRHFLPSHIWHITHPSGDEFQSFHKPALSSIEGFNRFAPVITGISPFQAFQSFNRFAPFKTFIGIKKLRVL